MVRDVEGTRHAKSFYFEAAGKDPIRVQTQTKSAPRRRARVKWRGVSLRLQILSCLQSLASSEGIKVT